MSSPAAFDRIAEVYDQIWTNSSIGRLQRAAVWKELDHIFRPGDHILDAGCGTGEDALHLLRMGVDVHAIDVSAAMVRTAQRKLADRASCAVLAIEDLHQLSGSFDGALANFGVLNCIRDRRRFARDLSRLVRPGGSVALCPMNRFCLWEMAWYLLRGVPSKAFRRLRGAQEVQLESGRSTFPVFYPPAAEIRLTMAPEFRQIRDRGVGIFVPPSYLESVLGRSPRLLRLLSRIDQLVSKWPLLRQMADHRLMLFVRN